MIKFTAASKTGITLVGLGITKANVDQLKLGRPIVVKGNSMGIKNQDIMIFYGETLESLQEQLKPFIGDGTKIEYDPKLADNIPEDAKTTTDGQSRLK